jgi:acyl-CoA synthetase (AMP-forming)/AMP-acid ligase II
MANLGNLIDLNKDLNKIAIIDSTSSVTYGQLHYMSNYYAQWLQDNNLKPGDKIAIIGLNSIGYAAAYLGILKLGAIAVLINAKLPEQQLEYILNDSEVKFVIRDPEIPEITNIEFESYNVKETDPALIIYTSGSASSPKGVILPHKHFWIIDQRSKLPNSHLRRAIVAAPLYHMNGLSNTETLLRSYATIILMPKFNAQDFIKNIERYKINSITSVPTMLAMILEEKELLESVDLTSVKYVIMASSPVSKTLFDSIKKLFSNAVVHNAYGITEVSPAIFGRHPTKSIPDMSVGYPTQGVDYRIVNNILQIRSPSMLLGYNKMNLSNITDDGYFITNDLFRVDDDGFYYFIGRADDMFVSGGHNIFPRQLEEVIETHSSIISSAVIGLPDDIKGMKPYAFVVVNSKEVTEDTIKQHLTNRLAPSHIPRKIWIIDALPAMSVNKIDKPKLVEMAKNLIASNNIDI